MKGVFRCIEAHTCGNPVRVVISGHPDLHGDSMFMKRQHFLAEYDWIRKGLMFEPRGHDMMSGSFLYPPINPNNDSAILFIETSGCLPMCGHGTIGTITVAIERGLIQPKIPGLVRLETPAGLVKVSYQMNRNRVERVKLFNIPSFCYAENLKIESTYLGKLTFDVSFGGNFYAIIDPQENFKGLQEFNAEQLIIISRELRSAINEKYTVVHPENQGIRGLSHILWTGETIHSNSDGRNAVFYGDKAIDRSPCGTGTSARMAQLFVQSKLAVGDTFVHESIIGSQFSGRIEEEIKVGKYRAIIPSIEGWAKIIGEGSFIIDEEDDPYALGFQVI